MQNEINSNNNLGHGERLTKNEYEKQIVVLYEDKMLSSPGFENDIHRRELDITIDYRLGMDFPLERREALWLVQQKVEKKRARLFFYRLIYLFSYRLLYKRADRLAGYLVKEYSKVLTKEELKAFFSLEENEKPGLPIDAPLLKK